MKTVAALSVLALALLLTGCGSDDSPAPAAPAATDVPTTASTSSATTSAAAATPDPADVAQARESVTAMLGPSTPAYLDRVNTAWPLTTGDRVNTAAGYAIGICAAKDAGLGMEVASEHVVSDFQGQYGLTITQAEGDAIVRAAWEIVCA